MCIYKKKVKLCVFKYKVYIYTFLYLPFNHIKYKLYLKGYKKYKNQLCAIIAGKLFVNYKFYFFVYKIRYKIIIK